MPKKLHRCLLTSDHSTAEFVSLSWTLKQWPFHPHWELLLFLFYYLLKSAESANLFSYPLWYYCICTSMYIYSFISAKSMPIHLYWHSYIYTHIHYGTNLCASRDRRVYNVTYRHLLIFLIPHWRNNGKQTSFIDTLLLSTEKFYVHKVAHTCLVPNLAFIQCLRGTVHTIIAKSY